MAEQITNNNSTSEVEQTLRELKRAGNFDISPCDNITNIDDNPKFKKIELSSAQKMHMSALASQLPNIISIDGMVKLSNIPNLYVMDFPKGLPYTLVTLKQGGYTSVLRDVNGQFAGYAPLYRADISSQMATQAAVLGTFTAMSVVTGQYFLTQINDRLDCMKLSIDRILDFLYGDKKAELMSEVNFAKYAYQNYGAIMAQESQKTATIVGLQQARKVAMKDSEFYISDLEATIQDNSDIVMTVNKALQIHDSLNIALQLCVLSNVLEVYYAQNFNSEYLKYIEQDVTLYIDKCEKCILSNFSKLHEKVENFKGTPLKKIDKDALLKRINEVLEPLNIGGESELKKSLRSGLSSSSKKSTYYLSKDGDVYVKN